jgi:hypothetical protein
MNMMNKLHITIMCISTVAMRILLVSLSLLCMQACSRDAKGGPSGAKSVQQSVIIIREIKPEYPQAYIKAMRELQERCITARAEVSNLQGKTYDGANDRWSDNDILILSAGRIEEYFDSSKYAVYKTISQPDLTKMDAASPDLSCRAPIKMIKTVDIEQEQGGDSCKTLSVNYASKKRNQINLPLSCKRAKPAKQIQQVGEAVNVEGIPYQCKWSAAEVNTTQAQVVSLARQCTLIPDSVHGGTARPLIAVAILPDTYRLSTAALSGTEKFSLQAFSLIEKAIDIQINTKIDDSKFTAPEDSLAFPLTEVS